METARLNRTQPERAFQLGTLGRQLPAVSSVFIAPGLKSAGPDSLFLRSWPLTNDHFGKESSARYMLAAKSHCAGLPVAYLWQEIILLVAFCALIQPLSAFLYLSFLHD